MGVLKFTSWLKSQQEYYNYNFYSYNVNNIDNLLIDANSTFYDAYKKAYDSIGDEDIDKLEDLIISNIIDFYNNLIDHLKPHNVYIYVDGVVPFSKITQQRIRRYTSYILDNNNLNWQANSNISPGTSFMKKLDNVLTKYCNDNNYVYSSFNNEGEGEHKIIQNIKNKLYNQNNIIYGNDTDIIFLSLIAHITKYTNTKNIYLYRPEGKIDIFYNVYKIKILLLKIIKKSYLHIKDKIKLSDNELILDFITICFIIGNDFLQNVPFIDAFNLKYVINAYIQSLDKFNLNETIIYKQYDKYIIDYYNLSRFLRKLNKYEDELFKNAYYDNNLMNSNHCYKKLNDDIIKINEIRNIQKDYYDFDNIIINKKILEDKYKLHNILINYKYNYYYHYFKSNNRILINNIIDNYIEGFNWTVDYYFNTYSDNELKANCLDWYWYYKYNCMPFISDISYYLKYNYDKINIKINKSQPLTIEQQLLYIIPYKNLVKINKNLSDKLLKYKYLSPENFRIDTVHKKSLWQCHCIIPLFNVDIIQNIK